LNRGLKRVLEEDHRKEETFAFGLFAEALGKTVENVERPGSGQPDFIADIDDQRVGIELTETVSSVRREREELAFQIVGAARDLYEKQGGPPLEVRFQFHDRSIPRDKDIPERILQIILSTSPEAMPLHALHYVPTERLDTEVPFVASILVIRKQDGRTNVWSITDAGTVLELSREDIETMIARKETALRRIISANAMPLWLVTYTFDNRVSGSADLGSDAAYATYPTEFNKLFHLDAARKALVELRLAPRDELG
jgi:hypothetical protein